MLYTLSLGLAFALNLAWYVGCHECGVAYPKKKIVGGEDVVENKYPWFALLLLKAEKNTAVCAGTLVSHKHVLTAAHCFNFAFDTPKEDLYKVGLGILNICNRREPTREEFSVVRVLVHGEYNSASKFHDIAMMTLATEASNFQLACLPPQDSSDKKEPALIIGFGATDQYTQQTPCRMQEARVTKYTKKQCRRTLLTAEDVGDPGVFCAGKITGGVDTCQGDSGGPLLTVNAAGGYVVSGVVSYGYGCANPMLPGIYTDVGYYRQWADMAMQGSSAGRGAWGQNSPEAAILKPVAGSQPAQPSMQRDIFNRPLRNRRPAVAPSNPSNPAVAPSNPSNPAVAQSSPSNPSVGIEVTHPGQPLQRDIFNRPLRKSPSSPIRPTVGRLDPRSGTIEGTHLGQPSTQRDIFNRPLRS